MMFANGSTRKMTMCVNGQHISWKSNKRTGWWQFRDSQHWKWRSQCRPWRRTDADQYPGRKRLECEKLLTSLSKWKIWTSSQQRARLRARLTNFQYFNQRLLNKDSRYASSPCFVYAASTYIEKQQLEGTRKSAEEGKTIFNLEDSFAVLDKISNTPKCIGSKLRMSSLLNWKTLGHFNFSSHCHVQKSCHVENFAVILKNSLGSVTSTERKPKVMKTPMNHNQRLHF